MENNITRKDSGACAVFLDIDGTLIAKNKLPPENVKAIAEAQAKGHKVLLNTGRSYAFIPWEALSEIHFDGVCAGCGSYVRIGGEVLHSVALENEFVAEAADAYKENGKFLFLEGERACFFVNPQVFGGTDAFLPADKYPSYEIKDGAHFLREFGEHRISKLTYLGGTFEPKEKALWEKKLRVIEYQAHVESVIYGCDKALGMKIALDAFGIPRENSIAMGDSSNDIEMLEYAGVSVAMGNAPDDVKAVSSFVSVDAADGGVSYALRKILGL